MLIELGQKVTVNQAMKWLRHSGGTWRQAMTIKNTHTPQPVLLGCKVQCRTRQKDFTLTLIF